METSSQVTPPAQLLPPPPCPRCCGTPHEPDDLWLCDRHVEEFAAIAREEAAKDAARELAEDRACFGRDA